MISDGIYFRNVIIQALNDLVLESFVLLLLFVFRVCIWLCLGCFLRNVFLYFGK